MGLGSRGTLGATVSGLYSRFRPKNARAFWYAAVYAAAAPRGSRYMRVNCALRRPWAPKRSVPFSPESWSVATF